MRVLVVDDSHYARQIVVRALQRVLEASGCELCIEEASDGEAALDLALDGSYDLVISDLYMREMDGIELVRAMRGDGKTPVGLITSDASRNVHSEARAAGALFILTKPLEREALRRELERFFPV